MRQLVLWGHHIEEYQEMFDLSAAQLEQSILEYGAGASAFNSEMHALHKHVVSCDPLFVLDKDTLSSKVALIFNDMAERILREQDKFDFSKQGALDQLIQYRQAGIQSFLNDYNGGKRENRYVPLTALSLPFADFEFDLALSTHYLFADLDNQDIPFHVQAITELARVAKEVRIFPLIDRFGEPSALLGPVLLGLQQQEFGIEVREINGHLQPKKNAMLRVWAQKCQL